MSRPIEVRWPQVRHVEVPHSNTPLASIPPSHFTVDCGPRERIVNVEAYAKGARVWIVGDDDPVRLKPQPPSATFRQLVERADNIEWLRAELLHLLAKQGEEQ